MRSQLRVFMLRALRAASGEPMTEGALLSAARAAHPECLVTTAREALRELELEGWVAAVEDGLSGVVSYGLTRKGEVKAAQL